MITIFLDGFITGGEDVSAVSQTLDYSNSTAYDDSTSVTSSNVHMELLSSSKHHSPTSINDDGVGSGEVHNSEDSEGTHNNTSSSVKNKEKKKKDKVI